MLIDIENLGNPPEFWEYFKQITKIPRCSGKEEQIRQFIKNKAEKFGFQTEIDTVGNLMVRILPKGAKVVRNTVVLQCHMDMVCEKNAEIFHDFAKDPIELEIIEKNGEKWLTARGTTLGADNGVGIAYLMTIMQKIHNDELNLSPLEMLFTVDEESGLVGAFNVKTGFIDGEYLINIDSEEDDAFIIGCAGGINTHGLIRYNSVFVGDVLGEAIPVKIEIRGLIGGHSGVDIHRGRANAVKILSNILWKMNKEEPIFLNSINGGNRANAIPREATAFLYLEKKAVEEEIDFAKSLSSTIQDNLKELEPNLRITTEQLKSIPEKELIPKKIKDKLLDILYLMPTGPISMHPKIPDLVYTSTNLASIETKNLANLKSDYDSNIKIITSQRSLHEFSKKMMHEKIEALFDLADIEILTSNIGDYPGWEPNFDSKLLKLCRETYLAEFDDNPRIKAIHAGLECGILKKQFPKMEMISIGPTIISPHSPDERLKIKSIEKIWNFLVSIIKKIA